MRSLVVVEEIRMIFHTKLLQSSISQLLEYNKLEMFLEGKLHSIVSDRMLILCYRKVNINPKYRVLMFLPCTVHVSHSTWYRSQYVQDLHDLWPRTQRNAAHVDETPSCKPDELSSTVVEEGDHRVKHSWWKGRAEHHNSRMPTASGASLALVPVRTELFIGHWRHNEGIRIESGCDLERMALRLRFFEFEQMAFHTAGLSTETCCKFFFWQSCSKVAHKQLNTLIGPLGSSGFLRASRPCLPGSTGVQAFWASGASGPPTLLALCPLSELEITSKN